MEDADGRRSVANQKAYAAAVSEYDKVAFYSSPESSLSETSDCDDDESNTRKGIGDVFWLVIATFSASVGAGLSFGYGLSALNNPRLVIISDLQHGMPCSDVFMEEEVKANSNHRFELATSVFPLGCLLGAIVVGKLADKLGRRRTMLLSNILIVPMVILAMTADSFSMLIASRIFHGALSGITMSAGTTYTGEISPVSQRGLTAGVNVVLTAVGKLLASILGLPQVWGNCSKWRLVVAFPIVFSVLQIVGLMFSPSSPRYLYIYRHDKSAARKALEKLRGSLDVDEDLEEMKTEKRNFMKMEEISTIGLFRDRSLRRQLILTIMLHVSMQLSGINGVVYYSRTIFESAGIQQAAVAALLPSVLGIVIAVLSSFFIDIIGRRSLLLYGFGLMAFSYITMAMGFCFRSGFFPHATTSDWPGGFVLAGALGVVTGFGFGSGLVTWLLTVELFPQNSRATASSVGSVANYLCNFAVGQTYLILLRQSQPYGMITFVALNSIFWIFFYIYLPETSRKTTEEIQAYFRRISKEH